MAHVLEHNRLGVLGHYYGGMLDTQQLAYFAGHIELLEVDELSSLRREVHVSAIRERVEEFRNTFDVQSDCEPTELERAARTSVALARLLARLQCSKTD